MTESRGLRIAGVTFDNVEYDSDGDVLYLHVGDPSTALDFDESPEGHHLRFGADGRLVGITLLGVREDLNLGRAVTVALPECVQVDSALLRTVVDAA